MSILNFLHVFVSKVHLIIKKIKNSSYTYGVESSKKS